MNSKLLLALCAASLAMVPACKKENGKKTEKHDKKMDKKGKKKMNS